MAVEYDIALLFFGLIDQTVHPSAVKLPMSMRHVNAMLTDLQNPMFRISRIIIIIASDAGIAVQPSHRSFAVAEMQEIISILIFFLQPLDWSSGAMVIGYCNNQEFTHAIILSETLMENRLFSLYNEFQRGNCMQFSLYPYNYWCLIAAFILLLVFLVLTFLRARPQLKQLNTMKPQLASIQEGIEATKIKADTVRTKAKKDVNQGSGVLSSLMILHAIRKDYKSSDGSGMKQFLKSAEHVYSQKATEDRLIRKVKNNLKK